MGWETFAYDKNGWVFCYQVTDFDRVSADSLVLAYSWNVSYDEFYIQSLADFMKKVMQEDSVPKHQELTDGEIVQKKRQTQGIHKFIAQRSEY